MSPDIIVIGAGIQGAGIAQAAAAGGYSVEVLEQHADVAQGTSRASSKLIHGGLRYLEQGQFSLVRESLRERAYLLRNAPELVRLVPFYIPVYTHTRRSPAIIRTGLSLYALLGGLHRENRYQGVAQGDWNKLDGLRSQGLRAVFRYLDGQTDDARLTRAVMDSALELGARLHTGAHVTDIMLDAGEPRLRYVCEGQVHERRCRVIVNAAGAWARALLARVIPPLAPPEIELVQGTHIRVPGRLTQGVYYVEAPQDARAVFIMPWGDDTLVGTTETPFSGDPAGAAPLAREIDYLLDTLRWYFPKRNTGRDTVIDAFAGLRVLPHAEQHAFMRARETLFLAEPARHPRLLSVIGGKLTTYRAAAEKTLERIKPSLPERSPRADTRTLRLHRPWKDSR